ncbi:MAG: AAA domain-containing protein, partial [Chitinophagaceae bacterium]
MKTLICALYICVMDYFRKLNDLLQKEKEAERSFYSTMNENMPLTERRANGVSWYPIVIKDTESGIGDYLTVECERPTHQHIIHQFRFGMSVAMFSNHDHKNDRVEGVISYLSGNRMKINMRVDELPDWSGDGKLGIDAIFDQNSFEEMEKALRLAPLVAEKKEEGRLVRILTGEQAPSFSEEIIPFASDKLNLSQQSAVEKILSATDLAIVHGPPGTGKTTTLVQAIKALH